MNICHVVGARPNFMKAAPVMSALTQHRGIVQRLVHTGQHFDANMSDVFFQQLGLPEPAVNLEVGSGSHAAQTAQIMVRFEQVVRAEQPDLVLVYGDVNSTLAAALVCAKLNIPVGHVEAGLRSFDRTMPEEVNRLLTDRIADLLFTPSADGDANLLAEGIDRDSIFLVGNVMIDTLVRLIPVADTLDVMDRLGLSPEGYVLVTLHRPSNVDDPIHLAAIMAALDSLSRELTVVFPVHPRTRQRLQSLEPDRQQTRHHTNVLLLEPLDYLSFLKLQRHAAAVVTDSGGIQEETTFLGIPCLTLRENTERPVTITVGTNQLVGHDMGLLVEHVHRIMAGQRKQGAIPPLWDGRSAERIAQVIVSKW